MTTSGRMPTMMCTTARCQAAEQRLEKVLGRGRSHRGEKRRDRDAPGPVPDANFTARDRQQLAHPPYQQAWIPPPAALTLTAPMPIRTDTMPAGARAAA
jgi:hypothetical protein